MDCFDIAQEVINAGLEPGPPEMRLQTLDKIQSTKMDGYRGLEPFWSWNLIPYMTTKNLACSYRFLMNIPSSLWFRISEDVSTGIQDILSKLFQIQRCMKTSRIQCGKGLVHLLFVHVTSIFSLPRIRLVTTKLVVALRNGQIFLSS